MRVLVTGGAGYIGSTLVPMLLERGCAVHVVDDLRYGQHLALAACARYPLFSFTQKSAGDLTNEDLGWCDAFVPLAAMVGAPLCERYQDESFYINYKAIDAIMAHLSRDQLVVYPNTNSGYGSAGSAPVTEYSPLNPISWYGRCKCSAERSVLQHDWSVVLRLATVYGMSPRMRLDLLVNDFVNRALRDRVLVLYEAHFRRSVVHVRDVARAFCYAIENPLSGGPAVFNVAAENVTKRGLAQLIQDRLPETKVIEDAAGSDPDQRDYEVSSAKLLATGFRFEQSLTDGIDELVRYLPMLPQFQYGNV